MVGEVLSELFSGFLKLLIIGGIAIVVLIIIAINFFFFKETSYKSKNLLKPDVVIESKTVNGIQKSDTTYIYNFK